MELDAIVDGINQGEGFSNITVKLDDQKSLNIKVTPLQLESIKLNELYHFSASEQVIKEKDVLVLDDFSEIYRYYNGMDVAKVLKKFYNAAPCDLDISIKYIETEIEKIKNEKIKLITSEIYNKNKDLFIIYPAATRFHHAYISGLIYHTKTMLEISKGLMEVYNYLNSDLVVSGIILHDICKVIEFSDAINPSYTLEGQLIGHLVLGALEVEKTAIKLGLEGEEILLLKHIIISHHGQYEFGSPKKPMIPEAILVSIVDNMDSKMTVLGEMLNETKENEFTNQVNVLDRMRIYKHNI